MSGDNVKQQLTLLRDELSSRNEIERLRREGEEPPQWLSERLREPSLEVLLARLAKMTSIPGGEDRVELEAASPEVKVVGESVALICSKQDLRSPTSADPVWRLRTKAFLCVGTTPKQNFEGQQGVVPRSNTPGAGFLVGSSGRFLLTAGHVAIDAYGQLFSNMHCVFGYRLAGGSPVHSFAPADVIAVQRAVAFGDDWALLELASSAGRAGLALRPSGSAAVGSRVVTISYPQGLPAKTGSGSVKPANPTLPEVDLDLGHGSSGSPVVAVDAQGRPGLVEGIITRATNDVLLTSEGCAVWVSACFGTPGCWGQFVPIAVPLASNEVVAAVNA